MELWKDKSKDKERIFIYLHIDPKGQEDLQGHVIFLYDTMDYPDHCEQIVTQSNTK